MNTNTSLSLPSIKTILTVTITVTAMAVLSVKLVHAGEASSLAAATSVSPMRAVQISTEEAPRVYARIDELSRRNQCRCYRDSSLRPLVTSQRGYALEQDD